jgi:hypothetical protein
MYLSAEFNNEKSMLRRISTKYTINIAAQITRLLTVDDTMAFSHFSERGNTIYELAHIRRHRHARWSHDKGALREKTKRLRTSGRHDVRLIRIINAIHADTHAMGLI